MKYGYIVLENTPDVSKGRELVIKARTFLSTYGIRKLDVFTSTGILQTRDQISMRDGYFHDKMEDDFEMFW